MAWQLLLDRPKHLGLLVHLATAEQLVVPERQFLRTSHALNYARLHPLIRIQDPLQIRLEREAEVLVRL